jgi:hypothetical protein
MMARFLMAASAVLVLSACATAIEGPTQDLTIHIVGTGKAMCDLQQENARYRAHAPGSVRIQKMNSPLYVRCAAPGNRELSQVLEPSIAATSLTNVANGLVPGMTWDYYSGAMYKYPDRVVMDFSNMPPKPYDEPDYQKVFKVNPDMYSMEEFRPGIPALQSDIGSGVPQIPRRNGGMSEGPLTPEVSQGAMMMPVSSGMEYETLSAPTITAEQASTMNADSLTRMMNPQVFRPAE